MQLIAVDIHADAGIDPQGLPLRQLLQGLVDNPVADPQGQWLVAQRRNEQRRWQQAAFRVLPADQGLEGLDLAAAHVDLGLEVQAQLLVVQCLADLFQADVLHTGVLVMSRIEQVATVFADQLGLVHGLVGLAQQLFGVYRAVLRVAGDANAGGTTELPLALLPGLADALQNAQ